MKSGSNLFFYALRARESFLHGNRITYVPVFDEMEGKLSLLCIKILTKLKYGNSTG